MNHYKKNIQEFKQRRDDDVYWKCTRTEYAEEQPSTGRESVNVISTYNTASSYLFNFPNENQIAYTPTFSTFPPEIQKTPDDTTGVGTIIPPLQSPKDSVNVAMITLPGYVITTGAFGLPIEYAKFVNTPGWQLFGTTDDNAVFPYFQQSSSTWTLQIPITKPAIGSTYRINLWLSCQIATPTDVEVKIGGTTLNLIETDNDTVDYVFRYSYEYNWGSSGNGTNQMLTFTLKVTGTDFSIIAVQVPLYFKGAFELVRITGTTYDYQQPFHNGGSWPTFTITAAGSPGGIFNANLPYSVDRNGFFAQSVIVKGNFYSTGIGVGVNYSPSTLYDRLANLRISPSSSNGLNKASLVYQGGSTRGGVYGYTRYIVGS